MLREAEQLYHRGKAKAPTKRQHNAMRARPLLNSNSVETTDSLTEGQGGRSKRVKTAFADIRKRIKESIGCFLREKSTFKEA